MKKYRSLLYYKFLGVSLIWPGSINATDVSLSLGSLTDLTQTLVQTIADIGQPQTVQANSGTDILELINQYCGSANAKSFYLQLFIRANSGNPDIKSGATILTKDASLQLPACLYVNDGFAKVSTTRKGPNWSNPVTISPDSLKQPAGSDNPSGFLPNKPGVTPLNVAPGALKLPGLRLDYSRLAAARALPQGLANRGPALVREVDSSRLEEHEVNSQYQKLVRKSLDAAATGQATTVAYIDAFERSLRTQDILASNTVSSWKRLKAGAEIVGSSPIARANDSFALRPGIDETAAMNRLQPQLPSDASLSTISGFGTYDAKKEPQDPHQTSCPRKAGQPWPIDLAELQKVLELRKAARNDQPESGLVLVYDTGFPQGQVGTAPFDKEYFVKKSVEPDRDQEPYIWSKAIPPVYFNPGFDLSDHGVEVLSLALGGVDVLESNQLKQFVTSKHGYVLAFMGYKKTSNGLDVDGEQASLVLGNVMPGQISPQVINLSLKLNSRVYKGPPMGASIGAHRERLYVFAAGNDGAEITSTQEPASWGGANSVNVITVGGINPDGSYHSESNKSTIFVDIAAPGCAVPTYSWNSQAGKFEKVLASGTSLAAPLVSFTANLMHGDLSVPEIKTRILTSGRYYATLHDSVSSSRALDIPNALAVHLDTIRDRHGRLRLGHVDVPIGKNTINGQAWVPRTELLQISAEDKIGKTVSIATRSRDGRFSFLHDQYLIANELQDIVFREAVITAEGVKLGHAEKLEMRNLTSITFCDNTCFDFQ